jgi:hypothetical protein
MRKRDKLIYNLRRRVTQNLETLRKDKMANELLTPKDLLGLLVSILQFIQIVDTRALRWLGELET